VRNSVVIYVFYIALNVETIGCIDSSAFARVYRWIWKDQEERNI
jgi:hypothetical protein